MFVVPRNGTEQDMISVGNKDEMAPTSEDNLSDQDHNKTNLGVISKVLESISDMFVVN